MLRRPVTLTARLTATAVVLVAMVSLLVAGATAVAMSQFLTARLDQEVQSSLGRLPFSPLAHAADEGEAQLPPPSSGDGDGDRDGDYPRRVEFGLGSGVGSLLAIEQPSGAGASAVTSMGAAVIETSDHEVQRRQLDKEELRQLADVPADGEVHEVHLGDLGEYRVAAAEDERLRVVTGLPTTEIRSAVLNLVLIEAVLAALGIAGAVLLGRALVGRELRPLRRVAATAHEVSAMRLDSGAIDLDARVDDSLTDPRTEVGQVGAALNTMLDHVGRALDARHRSEQQVRQFVADASHELRTPLATIQGYAELSRRLGGGGSPEDVERLRTAMGKVEGEAARMSTLVDDLLLLARLDAGRPLARDEVDVTRLLLEAVADARVVAPDHRWSLDLPEEPVTVLGDELRLHQVVSNLLTNARRHTPSGTSVRVGVRREGGSVVVRVHDDGPGIPPELAAAVFERFTRGDSSRTRDSAGVVGGGAGLGLSLVQAIVAAHGGSVAVDSRPGDTTFAVTLPA